MIQKRKDTSSAEGCGFFLSQMGLPTTTCNGRLKGRGDLQQMHTV